MEREVGGGIGMGNTCKPMAVSFQCMTKFTTNKKKKKEKINKKNKIFIFNTWHAANKYDLRLYIPLKVSYRTMQCDHTHTRPFQSPATFLSKSGPVSIQTFTLKSFRQAGNKNVILKGSSQIRNSKCTRTNAAAPI